MTSSGFGSEGLREALANAGGPSGKPIVLHYKLARGHWDPDDSWHKRKFRKREMAIGFVEALSFAHRIAIIKTPK
jgi:hypothetical protein